MPEERLRRAFVVFHVTLGLMLLLAGWQTLRAEGAHDRHAAILGAVETVAALLFLIPRTLRVGATVLLSVLVVAFAVHLHRGQWPGGLLVYAAAVGFVLVHGSGYRRPAGTAS